MKLVFSFILLSFFVLYCKCQKAIKQFNNINIENCGGSVTISNGECKCCYQDSTTNCGNCLVCSNIVFVDEICKCNDNDISVDCWPKETPETTTVHALLHSTSITSLSTTTTLSKTRPSVDTYLNYCYDILCNDYCKKPSRFVQHSCGASCKSVQLSNGQKCVYFQVNCYINGLLNNYEDRLCDAAASTQTSDNQASEINQAISILKIKRETTIVWHMTFFYALSQFYL